MPIACLAWASDDGLLATLEILRMLDHLPQKSMADLYRDLPEPWGTPTVSAHCANEAKYEIVRKVTECCRSAEDSGAEIAGQRVKHLITTNGVHFGLAYGSWGLVRASSNKPELVTVCESPVSRERMMAVVNAIRAHLNIYPDGVWLSRCPIHE